MNVRDINEAIRLLYLAADSLSVGGKADVSKAIAILEGKQLAGPQQFLFHTYYEGTIVHVTTDCVSVVFDVGDDIVEQMYPRNFFNVSPQKGDRIAVSSHAVKLPERVESLDPVVRRYRRKNVVPMPRTF